MNKMRCIHRFASVIREAALRRTLDRVLYIFDRFYKGKNAGADSVGIGLAMAKQIIQKMNGTIQVEKTSASGTVFAVRLYRSLK